MKKSKAALITLLGIVILTLAFTAYPPNQASARAEDKQFVAHACSGCTIWGNSCDVGTNNCIEKPCSGCEQQ